MITHKHGHFYILLVIDLVFSYLDISMFYCWYSWFFHTFEHYIKRPSDSLSGSVFRNSTFRQKCFNCKLPMKYIYFTGIFKLYKLRQIKRCLLCTNVKLCCAWCRNFWIENFPGQWTSQGAFFIWGIKGLGCNLDLLVRASF